MFSYGAVDLAQSPGGSSFLQC